jgi:perosamine synthetase
MAVTVDDALAHRMRVMSLHGLSQDAWNRYGTGGQWDYRIVAPGYKYNLTDVAASIGLHQLARAENMRARRESIAATYRHELAACDALELPPVDPDRIHAWHLFPIRLRTERLSIDRNRFIDEMRAAGIACSVHWRPLHLHPYYQDTFGTTPDTCPNATRAFERLVSLPLFSGMAAAEIEAVVNAVTATVQRFAR